MCAQTLKPFRGIINRLKSKFFVWLRNTNDHFHKASDAYNKIGKLLNGKDSVKNRKEIDRQLLIGRIALDKVDVFLKSKAERMNALQEEENRARADGRIARIFINDLGKYKKTVAIEYEKPHEYFSRYAKIFGYKR